MNNNNITIIADASYCPQTKAAGYGAWIAGQYGKAPYEGQLPKPVCNNTAEIMAIANALWHGMKDRLIFANANLLIQTDSLTAIKLFEGSIDPKNTQQVEAKHYVRDLMRRYNLKVTYRHVAGHTGGKTQRSKAQQHCDDRAKAQMIKARSNMKLDQITMDLGMKRVRKNSSYLRMKTRNNKEATNGA